jgi:hypothetical protein
MNLQRYITTVYSELIPEKYYKTLNADIAGLTNVKGETFESIRKKYCEKNEIYGDEGSLNRYTMHTLFFEILFGNHLETIYKRTKNTVFLFPIYFDIESDRRLTDLIQSHYKTFLKHKESEEFTRVLGDPEKGPIQSYGNMVLFVPVFSDTEEDTKEFTDRVNAYFDRAFTFINEVRQKKANDASGKAPPKFESIVYTIDKDKRFFTGYYKKKLSEENVKTLNGIIEKFVEKLGCRISDVKDPVLKLIRDETRKKITSDGKDKGKDKDKDNPYSELRKNEFKEKLYVLIDKFNDLYKKTNDREYLKLASSSENQTKLRLYYRVNNTDIVDSYTEIKPGSSYVYKITNPEADDPQKQCCVGYFRERKGTSNQYVFREYKGLSKANCKPELTKKELDISKQELEEEEDKDFKDEPDANMDEYIIETKVYGSVIRFKEVVKTNYKASYPGKIELFMDLHIYEKYKWFQFNEIDGTLSPETNIKIYKNILFDKKSLTGFLKEKNLFNDKTRLAVEFLKINQSNALLSEYVDYIMTKHKSTNVYVETLFSGKLKPFVEKNKKSILSILFQTNELIYMNPQRTSQTKENIKQNYKIISQNSYPLLYKSDVANHFDKIIYDDIERKYCKKGVCELDESNIEENSDNNQIEYALAIIDVTKDNVEVASDLKAKAKCKKLRRTLRKQLQPFLEIIAPRLGGRGRKNLRTRRRKNRH